MKEIHVYHTHIEITDYELGDSYRLEKDLSIWDKMAFQYIPVGYYYNPEKRIMYVPRGYSIAKLELMFNTKAEIHYTPDPYDEVSIKLKSQPRNDTQKNAIAFLSGKNEYNRTLAASQLLLELDPGVGKTFIAIASITLMRMKPIIIVHQNKIMEQWVESLLKFTDLTMKDICIVEGSKSVESIIKKPKKCKVYIIKHGTLSSHRKRYGDDRVSEFFKAIRAGIKIYDEAHLYFGNTINTDFLSNTRTTIYLTATFDRSSLEESILFKLVFSEVLAYEVKNTDDIKKHCIYIAKIYNSKPRLDEINRMETMAGFSKMRFSDYSLEKSAFWESLTSLTDKFTKEEGKLLILTTKIDAAKQVAKTMKELYPDKMISEFHSQTPLEDKAEAMNADIICSTPKSAGTGVDIPGLRFLIMTETYSSTVEAEQVSGRLRPYKNGEMNTFYVELIDAGFKKVYNAWKKRLPVFKKKCLKILKLGAK